MREVRGDGAVGIVKGFITHKSRVNILRREGQRRGAHSVMRKNSSLACHAHCNLLTYFPNFGRSRISLTPHSLTLHRTGSINSMGILNAILGNSSELPPAQLQTEYAVLFLPGERVLKGYMLVRDVFLFTDKRLMLIDKQGLTGKKVEYQSIPYKSIVRFAVETAGTFDLDAELHVWIASTPDPISKQFTKQVNVYEVQSMLASMVCR